MAVITGLERTYDVVGRRESLEDVITMISPTETPCFTLFNRETATQTKEEWLEDSLATMSATLGANLASGTINTLATVSSGHGARFRADSSVSPAIKELIRVNEELMVVTDEASDVLTVERAYGDSVVAAHSAGDTVEILGAIEIEGSDAKSARAQGRSRLYNYTQVFTETINVSGTQQVVTTAGVTTEFDYQTAQRMKELAIQVERAIINGARAAGSNTAERTMGGLWQFISTHKYDKSAATFAESHFNQAMREVWDSGGEPSIIVCNSFQADKIQGWYKDRIRTDVLEAVGGMAVNKISTIFGDVALLLDRWVPQHEVLLIDPTRISIGVLRPFALKALSATGDSEKAEVIGEYTLKVRAENAHARIYNLATS